MKRNNIKVLCRSFILAAFSMMFAFDAYAVNFTAKSKAEIRGEDPGLNVSFSSILESENYVVINIDLGNEKRIVAEIDYATKKASIKSISLKSGAPIVITQQDIFLLNMLKKSIGPVASRTGDALASILSFLSEAPHGEIIDILTDKEGTVGTQAIESLCDATGGTVTGRYDIKKGKNAQQVEETVQVGPCYNQSNECLGRCGPGCDAPPDETVQRFTQDCLNHDLCTRATGKIFGQCRDEWIAAADDFLFAPDCGDVTDIWNDNSGYVWNLEQSVFTIAGSVEVTTPQCGTWSVQGTHVGSDILLTATNPPPIEEGCCTAFSYTGTLGSCNTASGTWTNECGFSGAWNMSRGVMTLLLQAAPSIGELTPASSK